MESNGEDTEDTWMRSEAQFWPRSFNYFLKITEWGHSFANIEAFLGGMELKCFVLGEAKTLN